MVAGMRTAGAFLAALESLSSDVELRKYKRAFPQARRGTDRFLGVPMGAVLDLAQASAGMPIAELEELLASPWHEARAGALCIMDVEARSGATPTERRGELFELYLRRHDRINSWDLVDRAAMHVVGGYLAERPRFQLYELASSPDPYERRTAIVAATYFLRTGDCDDLFALARLLAHGPDREVQKATGWALRAAGSQSLERFLDQWAPRMDRTALRYAVEKLPKTARDKYLKAS